MMVDYSAAFFVFVITIALFTIQMVYILRFLGFYIKPLTNNETPPVSLIVVGKNERENWPTLLTSLCKQDHPNFEIVVVNDRSTDDSLDVIESVMKLDARVRLVDVKPTDAFVSGKKYALTLGIKAARHEHLVFTDADCFPDSNSWVKSMAQGFQHGHIVLGYGDYIKEKGFLNVLIRWETLHTAMMSFSAASSGKAYMGIGRNLGYTKSLFFACKGFYDHMHLPMGDDDLFVNKAATMAPVSWVTGSKTNSIAEKSWKDWWRQKRRHMFSSGNYRLKSKIYLSVYGMSKAFFYIGTFLLFASSFAPFAFILFFLYSGLMTWSAWHIGNKWKLGMLSLWTVVIDPLLVVLQGMLMIINYFNTPTKRWK